MNAPLPLLVLSAALSGPAFAAAGADETAATDKTEPALQAVVVTARKKSELLQQVPVSVSSLDRTELEKRRLDQLDQLANAVPGLQQNDLAVSSRLSLRGVNSGDNNAFEQAVGVYVDGVYRGRMNQQHLGWFDLERVEVLKGPQVALYGNSSIGGAISAVTRKPSFQGGGEWRLGYEGEYQTTHMQGAADLPLGSDLALRLAGSWQDQQRGYWPNLANDRHEPDYDHQAIRLSALWLASDALSVNLRHETGRYDRGGQIFDVFKHVDGAGEPWPNSPFSGLNDGVLNIENGAPFKYRRGFSDADIDETLVELNYDSDRHTLTSTTALSRYDYRLSTDVDITPATLINVFQDERYRQFSQELRLSNSDEAALSYLAGVYYQRDDFRNDYFSDFNLPALVAPAFGLDNAVTAGLLSPFSRHILLDQRGQQSAVFGHVEYAFNDRLSAGLGLRYQHTRKRADQAVRTAGLDHIDSNGPLVDLRWLNPQLTALLLNDPAYLADPTGYVLVLPDGTRVDPVLAPNHLLGYQIVSAGVGVPHEFNGLRRSERQPMLQASLAWQHSPDLLLYARWANGAKAGGFDFQYERGDRDEVEYGDESANVIELGMKRDWSSLRLNLAAYYGRYDDLQVSVFDGGIGFVVGNAASSESKGMEGELHWQIADAWQLRGQWSYTDFRYRHFPDANCSTTERLNSGALRCDWSGRRTPFVPEWEAGISLHHQQQLGRWQLQHDLHANYKGDHATASDSEIQTRQPGYTLLDYRVELRADHAPWSLALAGRNLADRQYNVFTSVIPLAPGGAFAYVRAPGRQLELEFHYRF
ncbi:TonB-dependent receptor [Pseudomarimonas arenosa]|uniref:TonB-dependent receptor n=1 Tax=Pseudomarimonas arenosa TaxID=2774145 RepID=A0AAW3ZP83_9GAMM|nr:TonB-dependent receptor [Pseudomarimonas arenosa]MBD8527315.1 TonB-dependent receptor [Pseudomarimonas arenosa]